MIERIGHQWLALGLVCLLAACGAKKNVVATSPATVQTTETRTTDTDAVKKLTFVQKVSDNQLYTKNIVGNMSFNIQAGSKDITVPGALRMRKDEVIRIQLFVPLLGSEVGRVEFTPEYVLIVDRIHKEYIKTDYMQLDFLKKNGLNFYSLQALFWNQLLLPGADRVRESDLKKYDVKFDNGKEHAVSLKNNNISYTWNADAASGRINQTKVIHTNSKQEKSVLNWIYTNFKSVGVKSFPAHQAFSVSSPSVKDGKSLQVTIDMDEVTTREDWDAQSTVSDKYKKVEAADVFSKILNM